MVRAPDPRFDAQRPQRRAPLSVDDSAELDGHALGIGVLCQKALLSMLEHADRLEQQLDAHPIRRP